MTLFKISLTELITKIILEEIQESVNIIVNEKINKLDNEYNNYLTHYFFIIKLYNILTIRDNDKINDIKKKELKKNKNYQKIEEYLNDNIDKITNTLKNILNTKNYIFYENIVLYYEENIKIEIVNKKK